MSVSTCLDFCDVGSVADDRIREVTVMAQEAGKWLVLRHHDRATWEIPQGLVETAERPLEAAQRLLCDLLGVSAADFTPMEVYCSANDHYGMLFLANVRERDKMAKTEVAATHLLPKDLTDPDIQPKLFSRLQYRLNIKAGAQERWDVLDEHRQPKGYTHPRGVPLPTGDYHLVVLVLILNEKGELLITRRAPTKGYPNMWEVTGGSALAGDDSLQAALREAREETGIALDPACGCVVATEQWSDSFCDIWLFRQNFDVSAVILQEGETTAAMAAPIEQILQMERAGEFVPFTPTLRRIFETELK